MTRTLVDAVSQTLFPMSCDEMLDFPVGRWSKSSADASTNDQLDHTRRRENDTDWCGDGQSHHLGSKTTGAAMLKPVQASGDAAST